MCHQKLILNPNAEDIDIEGKKYTECTVDDMPK